MRTASVQFAFGILSVDGEWTKSALYRISSCLHSGVRRLSCVVLMSDKHLPGPFCYQCGKSATRTRHPATTQPPPNHHLLNTQAIIRLSDVTSRIPSPRDIPERRHFLQMGACVPVWFGACLPACLRLLYRCLSVRQ